MQKSYQAKAEEISRDWLVVDLQGQTLGRAATQIATLLRGKHKPGFTPHIDTGDFVVAVNAGQVTLTGNKRQQKQYHHHTGWIGGLKTATAAELLERQPEALITSAVKGMLPKNSLGRNLLKKLKVYAGAQHPHAAQAPKSMALSSSA